MSSDRVSIQYSIPIRELPEEVRRLVGKVNTEIDLLKDIELWQRDVLTKAMFYNIDEQHDGGLHHDLNHLEGGHDMYLCEV